MCGAYNVPVHAHFGSVIPSSPSSSQLNTFLFLSHGMRSMICIAFSVQQALYVDRGLMRSIRSQNGWRCVRDGEVSEVMRRGSVIRAQIWSRRAIRNYQLPAITNYQLHHSDGNRYPRCLLPSMSLQCQARTTLVGNSNSTWRPIRAADKCVTLCGVDVGLVQW